MHFGAGFRVFNCDLTHFWCFRFTIIQVHLITHHPSSNFKSAPPSTSNLVSVDLLDVLDRLALQVLGVDLLGGGIGLDDGLGFRLECYDDMSELGLGLGCGLGGIAVTVG